MTDASSPSFYPIAWMPKRRWSWLNSFWAFINKTLITLSGHYVRWRGIKVLRNLHHIHQLPFNLLVKYCHIDSDVEREAHATMMARAMGLPVPRILGYSSRGPREKKNTILMTRIPGKPLSEVYDSYSDEELDVIMTEVGACLGKMRAFASPYGTAVCGLDGEFIANTLLPFRKYARTGNPQDFHESINLWPPNLRAENFDALMQTSKQLEGKDYRVVFGHGDLAPWNIMVRDGHLTGIIDWEYAGWYPEYWDYVNPVAGYGSDRYWARDLFLRIPGSEKYEQERQTWGVVGLLYGGWMDL